jgi:hypothetical protein
VNDGLTATEIQSIDYLTRPPISETMSSNQIRNGCLGSKSMTLEERLETWIVAHCLEENPRPQRVRELNAIFREIYNDRRFWKYKNIGNPDDYEDALFLMWRYFLNNLCEAKTARIRGSFLEYPSYAVGRLLKSLEGNIKNIWKKNSEEQGCRVQPPLDSGGNNADPIGQLPYPEPEPEEPGLSLTSFLYILETSMHFLECQPNTFLDLLEKDPDGELKEEINTLSGKTKTTKEPYTLTAQTYLLMIYRDGKTIHEIADELDISRGSVQGGAKPQRWRELGRKYSEIAMNKFSTGIEEDSDDI